MSEKRLVYSDGWLPPVSPGTKCTAEEGKTRQSERESADINVLVKRYETTGVLPESARTGVFMDVSEMPSFQAALNQVAKAATYFMSLPPDVRALFDNEPAKMLDAWQAGEQLEVFEKIGWLERKPEAPSEVELAKDAPKSS